MKRPSFQFYPADWKANAKLRRCSEAARGAWIDVLCLLHDSDEYGVIYWPLEDIARAAGVHVKHLKELVAKGVMKGGDKASGAYVFIPRHAGKDGSPIELLPEFEGHRWYCSRFVRDEHVRQKRGFGSRFDSDNQPDKTPPKQSPKGGIGERVNAIKPPPKQSPNRREGDGPSSSSSSSSSSSTTTTTTKPEVEGRVGFAAAADAAENWAQNHPLETAKAMGRIQNLLNDLNPAWQKRPHFSAKELHGLADNAAAWLAVPDEDWQLLTAYMEALIPEAWRENPRDYPQPDNRLGIINMGPSSILSFADKWARKAGFTIKTNESEDTKS